MKQGGRACRFKSCNAVILNYGVLIHCLKEEIEAQSNKDVAQAIGILIYFFTFFSYYFIYFYY